MKFDTLQKVRITNRQFRLRLHTKCTKIPTDTPVWLQMFGLTPFRSVKTIGLRRINELLRKKR